MAPAEEFESHTEPAIYLQEAGGRRDSPTLARAAGRRVTPSRGRKGAQPDRGGRERPPAFVPGCCKERNTVERCFSKLKQFRAVVTRYDKRDFMYRGTVDIASIRIWLRDPVP